MVETHPKFDVEFTRKFLDEQFDTNIKPAIFEFIRIPNLSRGYDKDWASNGLLEKAAEFMIDWSKQQGLKGFKVELLTEKEKTPLIFAEIEGSSKDAETILFYGHLDKQPHMTGWNEGLGPVTPVEKDGKIYGRGGADDGYAWFAAIIAIKALQLQKLPHNRIVIIIEADEETASRDLPHYFDLLKDRIGTPALTVCTDSGCGNYEQLWITTSLRGYISGILKVKIITEGVHSGDASGVIPETFRIVRKLLDRVENVETGEVARPFHVNIPGERYKQAQETTEIIGQSILEKFPWVEGAKPVDSDPFVSYLNRVWRPQLAIIGIDGLPPTAVAGNVLRPETTVKLSLRLPPTLDSAQAVKDLKRILEENPPYGAQVTFEGVSGNGWNSPVSEPYLDKILNEASLNFFGKPAQYLGEGGSIPLMNFFANRLPKSQFIVTGVLGPFSNAHGPNEFLHIDFTKKLIMSLTQVVADIYPSLKQR